MYANCPSLLDLPDLALEEISKNLSLRDLTGTMQTCSKMNNLLRPLQTTLV